MARYIDADKFLRDQIRRCGCVPLIGSCTIDNESLKDIIERTPTADVVEVKHGCWKRNERNVSKMKKFREKGIALSINEKSIFYTCTCCGSFGSLYQKYCFECGAKMDGRSDT